jgi:hypothetical protein
VDKENNQVPACIRLSSSGVHVFTCSMSQFDKSVTWTIEEHIFNFILSDVVLDSQLLYYVGKPDEIINLQGMAPSVTVGLLLCNTVLLQPTPTIGIEIIPQ